MIVGLDGQRVPEDVEGVQAGVQDVVLVAVHACQVNHVEGGVRVIQLEDRLPETSRHVKRLPPGELVHFGAGDLADELPGVGEGLEVHGEEDDDLAPLHRLERVRERKEHLVGVAGVDLRPDGALVGSGHDPADVRERLLLARVELLEHPDGVGEFQDHRLVPVHHVLDHELLEPALAAPEVHRVGAATVEHDHEPAGRGVARSGGRRIGCCRSRFRDGLPQFVALPIHYVEARHPLGLAVLEEFEVVGGETWDRVSVVVEHQHVHDDPGGGGAEPERLAGGQRGDSERRKREGGQCQGECGS